VPEEKGKQTLLRYIDTKTVIIKYELPLSEIIVGFYDALKSIPRDMLHLTTII